jgi:SAM-dependent methyltransferase
VQLSGLTTGAQDLTALTFSDNSIPSLSCMHVIEHVGLGRYGGTLDPQGDLKAARELKRVLAPGGTLLIVVPVGTPRVCFNAHRIYGYSQVLSMFEGLTLDEFAALLDDPSQGLVSNASPELVARQYLGCGCFSFKKPQ